MARKNRNARSEAARNLRRDAPPEMMEEGMSDLPMGGIPMGAGGAEMTPNPAGMPPGGPDLSDLTGGEGAKPPSLEDALMSVEVALADLPPDKAEEVRNHLNAIKEIVSEGASTAGLPMQDQIAQGVPPPEQPMGIA